jgi:hypothetical protein
MIKSIYFPDKTYSTKEELFKDLKDNLDFITDAKKSQIQKSCDKGVSVTCKSLDLLKFTDQLKGIKIDDNFYYIAVNSTKVLDSHDDLHLDGIWNKSVKEQQGKNYLVIDHELEVDKVIVRKEHIEMFVAKVPFALLGKPYEGDTQALIYKVPKAQVKHQAVKDWLDSGDEIEASVRMQYVTFVLCLDSNDPDDATAKANYDQYFPLIANKDEFDYINYFFAIKEAKNVRESSLVVFGSNASTGQIVNTKEIKTVADEITTEVIEAEQSLQTEKQIELLKELLKKI